MSLLNRVVLFGVVAAMTAAADPMLTLLPGPDITGTPGTTIGWGYEIANDSSSWLETTSLSAPGFPFGIPEAIFDYPVVAPDSSVTVDFSAGVTAQCSTPPCGIYEVVLPATIPATATIGGSFDVTTELFGTNPLTDPNAVDLGAGPTIGSDFSATEIPSTSAVPEPGTYLGLIAMGLLCMCGIKAAMPKRNPPALPGA